jgi:ubiquinone/menaquinone biosynthesis C-methylase UbiE
MATDHYAGAGARWATGAALVYGPIASEMVARSPHRLAGRRVLDVGAGTGVGSTALQAAGATPIAVDFSFDMLAWEACRRPPAAVGDVCALPVAEGAVDDTLAAFVLNHLEHPAAGFAEIIRVTRAGGAVLAAVYSNASRSEARDRIDEAARAEGWRAPEWYLELKATAAPILGSGGDMARVAEKAGLTAVSVDERPVDVGVTDAGQLVEYRFGQAHFRAWLDDLGEERAHAIRRRVVEAVRPVMSPYRPVVVFLSALVPTA